MHVFGFDVCVAYVGLMFTSLLFPYFPASPLARGVVDLIALATAYRDGVEGLEGAQAYAGDGHEVRGKHDQDSLGVVEGHWQVVAHWDHQRVGATAETPLTCGEDVKDGEDKTQCIEIEMESTEGIKKDKSCSGVERVSTDGWEWPAFQGVCVMSAQL